MKNMTFLLVVLIFSITNCLNSQNLCNPNFFTRNDWQKKDTIVSVKEKYSNNIILINKDKYIIDNIKEGKYCLNIFDYTSKLISTKEIEINDFNKQLVLTNLEIKKGFYILILFNDLGNLYYYYKIIVLQ